MMPLRQRNGARALASTEKGGNMGSSKLPPCVLKEDEVDGRGDGDETGVNPGVVSGVSERVLIGGSDRETG